jgi:hypothetical protein
VINTLGAVQDKEFVRGLVDCLDHAEEDAAYYHAKWQDFVAIREPEKCQKD